MAYTNLCSTATVSVPGKAAVSEPPQCISNVSKPIQIQIVGNTLQFEGPTDAGGTVSFVGNYTETAISGTFTRESSYGKIHGTFDLKRGS